MSDPGELAIAAEDDPVPHWRYATTLLRPRGFEQDLCFRLARDPGADPDRAPAWPANFLLNLAAYQLETGNAFAAGHHVDCNGPISLVRPTRLVAAAFARDEEDPGLLVVAGLTRDEYEAARRWDTEKLLAVVARRYPRLVCELERPSILEDPELAAVVSGGIQCDGSSQSAVFVSTLNWQRRAGAKAEIEVRIGASAVSRVLEMLTDRIRHGKAFEVTGPDEALVLEPAPRAGWRVDRDALVLGVDEALAAEMRASLRPARGAYRFAALPGLLLTVAPSEIKDARGQVIRVIG